MGVSFSNKPNKNNDKRFYNLSDCVNYHMKIKNTKQSDLVNLSGLTKTTISRICRNSNDKGSAYSTKNISIIMALSIALQLTVAERNEMYIAAFPETEYWDKFLNEELNLIECNNILDDNGLAPMGNIKED